MADKSDLMAAAVIIELIMKYGVPAALQIITAWEVDEPTDADWEALKVDGPEKYFNP